MTCQKAISCAAYLGLFMGLAQASAMELCGLHGRVLGADKKPVVGANVAVADLSCAYIYFSSASDVSATPERIGGTVDDAQSRLHARSTQTDANGEFHFEGLACGEFGVVVSHVDEGVAVKMVQIDKGEHRLEISLPTVTRVLGQFKNVELDPQKNYLNLECISPYPWLNISVRLNVDDHGLCDSGPLPPVGEWSLVKWEWNISNAFTSVLHKGGLPLRFGSDAVVPFDFNSGNKLRGKVIGPDGKPIPNAAVVVRGVDFPVPVNEHGAITANDGGFEIRGVASGRYELNVERWRLRQTPGCGPGPRDVHLQREIEFKEWANEPLILKVEKFIPSVEAGDVAPEFVARTLQNKEFSLKSLRGKVVVLDFWATWCGMCQGAVPKLKELHKEFEKAGLVIVGVSVDTDPKKAASFVERHSILWTQTALGSIDANPVARMYNVNSTPTVILIGRDGKVIARDIEMESLREKVKQALDH